MKTLILLRHAKSSWKDIALQDHDRPLNKRGRAAAPLIGAWLIENGYLPQVVLCSTSLRTRETVERLAIPVDKSPGITFLPELYHASEDDLLAAARSVSNATNTAMIVGHQPGLSTFAGMLTAHAEPHCVEAYQHFPTAAVGVFQSRIDDWSDLAYCSANFTQFVKPRSLMTP